MEKAVAEANAELGADTVRMHCDNEVGHTFGCFERADLLVFNSTVDGQNLSVFEAPLVNERDADVVLSEMAGAAEILAPGVPYGQPLRPGRAGRRDRRRAARRPGGARRGGPSCAARPRGRGRWSRWVTDQLASLDVR